MERTLSIFCDESGDMGPVTHHSPYYIVSLVLHDQANPIGEAVSCLEGSIRDGGFPPGTVIHTAPLIRREPPYRHLDMQQRRRALAHLERFARCCDIKVASFAIDKRVHGSGQNLVERLAREMGSFVTSNLQFFQTFDHVIVYYDRGQKEVSKTLRTIFSAALFEAEFRTVRPEDYRLFQVADLACTMRLLEQKSAEGRLGASETAFFGNSRKLRKNHLRLLEQLERWRND